MEIEEALRQFKTLETTSFFSFSRLSINYELNRLYSGVKSLKDCSLLDEFDFSEKVFGDPLHRGRSIFYARVSAKIKLSDPAYYAIGSGMAGDRAKATIIAISEFFERIAPYIENRMRESNGSHGLIRSSNGIAFHNSKDRAFLCAMGELVQRDAFLAHWYTRKNAKGLDLSVYDSAINSLLPKDFKAKSYLLTSADSRFKNVVQVVRRGRYLEGKLNYFIGLGTSSTIENALCSAFYETFRFVSLYFNAYTDGALSDSGLRKGVNADVDRFLFYQSPEFTDCFDFLDGEAVGLAGLIPNLTATVEFLPIPNVLAGNFLAVRVHSDQILDLDFDAKPKLNLNRLRALDQHFDENCVRLHPIP